MPLVGNEYDPNAQIVVLRQHLQDALAALSWVHSYFTALDLMDAYRAGKPNELKSPVTRQIELAYQHLEGYVSDERVPAE